MIGRENNITGKGAEKLFNFRPFFFSAIFLSLGILFYFAYHFLGVSTLWLLLGLPLMAIPFFFCHNKRQVYYTVLTMLLVGGSFLVGFFSFSAQLRGVYDVAPQLGEQYVTGKVVEIRPYAYNTIVILDDLVIGEDRENGKLIAYLPPSFEEKVSLCDELFLVGKVYGNEPSVEEFHYDAGELTENIRFRIWTEEVSVVGERFDLFLSLRSRAESVIEAGMDESPAAVMSAMLFGNTAGIDDGLYENIRQGGIAHIFAVSGLHVGALFAFCVFLFDRKPFQRVPKLARWIVLAGILYLYAGVCGFSASVLRATVMCLVLYATALLSVKTDMLESLGIAGIVLLLYRPTFLFEVGFQLSFMACFGLAFLTKPLGHVCDEIQKLYRKYFPKAPTRAEIEARKNGDTLPPSIGERIYQLVRSFLSASIAVQLFTAPLLLHYFGYVSGWALLLNGIFVPIVSGLFAMMLLLVALASVFPVELAVVFLYIPNLLWSLLLLLFQTMDFSSFALRNISLSGGGFFSYYCGLLFATDKWNLAKRVTMSLSTASFAVFLLLLLLGIFSG